MRRLFLAIAVFAVAVAGVVAHGSDQATATHTGSTVLVNGADTTSDAGGCGDPLNPCNSIQAGINHADPGDTVLVAAGTYDEHVVIASKSLTVTGADRDTTIITDTSGSEEVVFLGTNSGSTFVGGLVFENFTVRGTPQLFGDRDVIKFRAAGDSPSTPVIVRNNLLDCAGDFSADTGARLAIEEANQPDPGNAVIEGNEMKDCTAFGMFFNSLSDSVIKDNTIDNSGAGGLYIDSSALPGAGGNENIDVIGNTITNSASRWTPAFGDNPFFGGLGIASTSAGIHLIDGNTISDGMSFGVVIRERSEGTDLSDTFINFNNITNNKKGSVNTVDADDDGTPDLIIDATCNWWGSLDGPSGEGPGSGDKVGKGFDFEPWLIAPAPLSPCPEQVAPPNKVTGGGKIEEGEEDEVDLILELAEMLIEDGDGLASVGSKATFGFVVQSDSEGNVEGNVQYKDHEADIRIKATAITSLLVFDDSPACPTIGKHAQFSGTAEQNGPNGKEEVDFTVNVDDCGQPNSDFPDRFQIETSATYMAEGPLVGGNIKIHDDE